MDPLIKCEQQLWDNFVRATEADPRGVALRISDEGRRVRCVLRAVALLVVPLIVEVARLRTEVAELRNRE